MLIEIFFEEQFSFVPDMATHEMYTQHSTRHIKENNMFRVIGHRICIKASSSQIHFPVCHSQSAFYMMMFILQFSAAVCEVCVYKCVKTINDEENPFHASSLQFIVKLRQRVRQG